MTQSYGTRQVSTSHELLCISQLVRSEDHRTLDHPGSVGVDISLDRVSEGLYTTGRTQEIYGLGALGLLLPKLTKIDPQVTIAAAIGLALLMLSTTVFHISRQEYSTIGMNVVLQLAPFIAVGYLASWAPIAWIIPLVELAI
jgi:hypothetical protein